MTSFDFSPLFRSTIGFDRLGRLIDQATLGDEGANYPPYNIEATGEDSYRITMAVAGFGEDDLDITVHDDVLVISGRAKAAEPQVRHLYRGIAGRAFEQRFQLADFIKATGARLANGLLHVELVREVPEAMRPRTIKIATGAAAPKAIDAKAA
ncbi:MAG: Hsp20 family protein [Pseudomonadota bacterium]